SLVDIVLYPRHSICLVRPHAIKLWAERLACQVKRRRPADDACCELYPGSQRAWGWTGEPRGAGDASTISPVPQMAVAAMENGKGNALLRRDPPQVGRNSIQWRPPHWVAVRGRLAKAFTASCRRDQLRIEGAHLRFIPVRENPSSGFDPIGLGHQFLGLDQRLRADVLQHLPVAFRLAAREVNGIGSEVVNRQGVVLFRGNVRGANIQSGDGRGPIRQRRLVPGFWNYRMECRLRPKLCCKQNEEETPHDQYPSLALESRQAIRMVRKALREDFRSYFTVQLA